MQNRIEKFGRSLVESNDLRFSIVITVDRANRLDLRMISSGIFGDTHHGTVISNIIFAALMPHSDTDITNETVH